MPNSKAIRQPEHLPLYAADFQFSIGRLLIVMTVSAVLLSFATSVNMNMVDPRLLLLALGALCGILFYDLSSSNVRAGHSALRIGKFDKAIELYSRAIRARDQCADRYCYRATAYAKLQNWEAAERDFSEAIRCNARYLQAWEGRSTVEGRRGNYQRAVDDATVALCLAPERIQVRFLRGGCYAMLARFDDALADLDAVLSVSPDHWPALKERAFVHFANGNYAACIADFGRVPPEHRVNLNFSIILALSRFRLGEFPAAFAELDEILQRNPTNFGFSVAAWFLATCPVDEFRDGSVALAFARFGQRCPEAPGNRNVIGLAAAYAELGRFDEAIAVAREAVEHSPLIHRKRYESYLACYEAHRPMRDGPVEAAHNKLAAEEVEEKAD